MNGAADVARDEHLARLRRVEGQVRGIARMIEDGRACGDVLLQLRAAINALCRLQDRVLQGHLRECLRSGVAGRDGGDGGERVVEEIFALVSRYRNP